MNKKKNRKSRYLGIKLEQNKNKIALLNNDRNVSTLCKADEKPRDRWE